MALRALFLNTTLKYGDEKSNTEALADEVFDIYRENGVETESVRITDYNVPFGISGVVVTGNEDGGKAAAKSILYSMAHNGFTIPPNVDTYWVGDAGPGPSYMEAGTDNEFTKSHVKMLAWNTMHLARLFKEHPIPAEGNTME